MVDTSALVIILAIGILTVLVAAIFIYKYKSGKMQSSEPDYRVFFILGIVWIPVGIAVDMSTFIVLGIVFMAIGLVNRDKWKKGPFSKRNKTEDDKISPSLEHDGIE